MDKREASEILASVVTELRTRSYDELRAMLREPHNDALTAPSGNWYQIEVQVFWDDRPEGDLRVIASIDDGGLSAFKPLSADFILAPDGSFVGE